MEQWNSVGGTVEQCWRIGEQCWWNSGTVMVKQCRWNSDSRTVKQCLWNSADGTVWSNTVGGTEEQ